MFLAQKSSVSEDIFVYCVSCDEMKVATDLTYREIIVMILRIIKKSRAGLDSMHWLMIGR